MQRAPSNILPSCDKKLAEFNRASLQYYDYHPPAKSSGSKRKFIPRIFYLRQVREDDNGSAFIEVASDKVHLPEASIQYFVFAEWNLKTERLSVFLEKEKRLIKIKSISFTLNPKSKEKISRLVKY